MHLVQLLLPLVDNDHRPVPRHEFERVERELRERFGGLTAHTRTSASGRLAEDGNGASRDEFIMYEVMTYPLDIGWWKNYRTELDGRFAQDRLVIRAHEITLL